MPKRQLDVSRPEELQTLVTAVQYGDVAELRKLNYALIPEPENIEFGFISAAVQSTHLAMLEFVLKLYETRYRRVRRVDLDVQGECRMTALHWAVQMNLEEMVEVLLELGANPNVRDQNGDNCLHLCAATRNSLVVQALVQCHCDQRATNQLGNTPLGDFIYFNGGCEDTDGQLDPESMECLRLLRNVRNNGYSRLLFACSKNALHAIKFFLDEGDDPNETCVAPFGIVNALILCALNVGVSEGRSIYGMKALLEKGANPEANLDGVHVLELLFSLKLDYRSVLNLRKLDLFRPSFHYILVALMNANECHLENLLVYGLNVGLEMEIPGAGDFSLLGFVDMMLRDGVNALAIPALERSRRLLTHSLLLKRMAQTDCTFFTRRYPVPTSFIRFQNQWVPNLSHAYKKTLRAWGSARLQEHKGAMIACSHNSSLYRSFASGTNIRQVIYSFLSLKQDEFEFAKFCFRLE